jgi:hypothetical protein
VKSASGAAVQVRLLNMKGRTVSKFNAKGGGATFSLAKLSQGSYLVEVRERGKRTATSAFIQR